MLVLNSQAYEDLIFVVPPHLARALLCSQGPKAKESLIDLDCDPLLLVVLQCSLYISLKFRLAL